MELTVDGKTLSVDVAQMESGVVVFGIGGARWGEITLKDGRVEQSNFSNYRVLRMNETPPIEIHLVGKRIRALPLQKALKA